MHMTMSCVMFIPMCRIKLNVEQFHNEPKYDHICTPTYDHIVGEIKRQQAGRMDNEYFINKLDLSKPDDQSVIVKTILGSDSIEFSVVLLKVCDTNTELAGEFEAILKPHELQEEANSIGCSVDELILKWKTSLLNASDFTYELIDNSLVWYKNDVVRVKYGRIQLTEVQAKYKLCAELLMNAIDKCNIFSKKYDEKCSELKASEQHSASMKNVYEAYVKEQKAKEQIHLTKFMVLLNEKKAQIKKLENDFRNQTMAASHQNDTLKSEDFNAVSTPDEIEFVKQPRIDDTKPSTSYYKTNDPTDDIYDQDTQRFIDSEEVLVKS